jgi:desulfoferrodoxin
MDEKSVSRRDFLNVAAAGAAIAMAGNVFSILGKTEQVPTQMKLFICSVCGHVEYGAAPEFCPVCHASKDNFNQNDALFSEAEAKLKGGGNNHNPEIIVKNKSDLIKEQPCVEVEVRIGKVLHPMEEAHHIRWIDCYADDKYVSRVSLTPGILPAATFQMKAGSKKVRIVEVCNLHGHWQSEANAA